jgi:hypothetical protein
MPSRAVQCDGFLTMTGGEGCDVGPPNIGTWGITDILVGGPEGFAVRVEDSRTVIADPEIDREEADTGSRNPLDEFAGVRSRSVRGFSPAPSMKPLVVERAFFRTR